MIPYSQASDLAYIILMLSLIAPLFLFGWLVRLALFRSARERYRRRWIASSLLMAVLAAPSLLGVVFMLRLARL